jgi:hypothetical protein
VFDPSTQTFTQGIETQQLVCTQMLHSSLYEGKQSFSKMNKPLELTQRRHTAYEYITATNNTLLD